MTSLHVPGSLLSGLRGLRSIVRLSMTTQACQDKPVEGSIKKKIDKLLEPSHVEVINESYMHSVPKGSETHFKVIVVSEKFDGKPLIQRHRLVNDALKEELESGVHALSIVAKTPKQWEESSKSVPKSPACMGGGGL